VLGVGGDVGTIVGVDATAAVGPEKAEDRAVAAAVRQRLNASISDVRLSVERYPYLHKRA
jgi:hypothetical protein